MALTAADILVDTIHDWGVDVIFGLPGDGINGIMESLRKRKDDIKFVHVRHEEAAAFMACGYAKYTGKLGVCLATSGPGGIHLLNGLYDAKLDHAPVLAITGMTYHDLVNTQQQQDVELDRLYTDVALYNARVMGHAHVENVTDIACRTALNYRGVSHITIPTDLQDEKSEERTQRNVPRHSSSIYATSARLPNEQDLQKAAELLNGGKKVVILAGQGALGAGAALERVAEKLGAPIIKALLGKAVVPDRSPYTTGGIGLLGTKPSLEAIEDCDTLFIVGSVFPYIEFYPKPGKVRAVQIDVDPVHIGLRFPVDVGLVGDSGKSLEALIPMLHMKEDRSFLKKAQDGMQEWWKLMEEQGTLQDMPMKPQVLAWELGKRLANDAIIAADSGTIATWAARLIPIQKDQMFSLSGNLATMANGLPYAMAAQVAYPNRQSVAFVGDGGFSMLMAEMSTCVKYKLPVKIFIVKNNVLGQIKWEQMVFLGNPEYGVQLEPIDFAMVAKACGATGLSVDKPSDVGKVIEEALRTPGPVVVEALVDQNEPPMPARITRDQASKFAESLVRGEPERMKIAGNAIGDKVRELI